AANADSISRSAVARGITLDSSTSPLGADVFHHLAADVSAERVHGAAGIHASSTHSRATSTGPLTVTDPSRAPRLGERIEFFPPHCDPTINLYDQIYAMRADKVEAAWEIVRAAAPTLALGPPNRVCQSGRNPGPRSGNSAVEVRVSVGAC